MSMWRTAAVSRCPGFTSIEVAITAAIFAIGVALAVPTFSKVTDKRRLTAAAEEINSFIVFAQSEAIKSGEEVTVSWSTPGGHNVNWCIGATADDSACDCTVTDATAENFCEIDGLERRLVQADFAGLNYELMHMRPVSGSFAFDPVRGIVTDVSDGEIVDNDYLFYLHSNEGSGSTRDYELQVWLNMTGRVTICTDDDRRSTIGGYPEC
jgi:Tfp pilus assembly protein FimT